MNRRELLKSGAACVALSAMPGITLTSAFAADATFAPQPSNWRSFEIKTVVNPAASKDVIRAWVPLAGFQADDWNRPEGNRWTTNAKVAQLDRDPHSGVGLLYLEWAPGEEAPSAEITSLISTRDRASKRRIGSCSTADADRTRQVSGWNTAGTGGWHCSGNRRQDCR